MKHRHSSILAALSFALLSSVPAPVSAAALCKQPVAAVCEAPKGKPLPGMPEVDSTTRKEVLHTESFGLRRGDGSLDIANRATLLAQARTRKRNRYFTVSNIKTAIEAIRRRMKDRVLRLESKLDNMSGELRDRMIQRIASVRWIEPGQMTADLLPTYHDVCGSDLLQTNLKYLPDSSGGTLILCPGLLSAIAQIRRPATVFSLLVSHELGHSIDSSRSTLADPAAGAEGTKPVPLSSFYEPYLKCLAETGGSSSDATIDAQAAELTADYWTIEEVSDLVGNLRASERPAALRHMLPVLCGVPGGPDHPSGNERIQRILENPRLRDALGCGLSRRRACSLDSKGD